MFHEITTGSARIYEGKIIALRRDEVQLQNGRSTTREVVEHSGGVCIAALTEAGELLFVRQFRYAHGRELLELPAGKRERGEDAEACARRELSEETGAAAGVFRHLGAFIPSSAYLTEVIECYFAADLSYGEQHLDPDEFLGVERIPLAGAVQKVLSGEIEDGKTQALILKVAALRAAGQL